MRLSNTVFVLTWENCHFSSTAQVLSNALHKKCFVLSAALEKLPQFRDRHKKKHYATKIRCLWLSYLSILTLSKCLQKSIALFWFLNSWLWSGTGVCTLTVWRRSPAWPTAWARPWSRRTLFQCWWPGLPSPGLYQQGNYSLVF